MVTRLTGVNTNTLDALNEAYRIEQMQATAPRGLRRFPCFTLPSCSSASDETAAGTENPLSVRAQRKAVKKIAAQTDAVIDTGMSRNERIPHQQRKLEYQRSLLQKHERLQHLKTLNLQSEPPRPSMSRAAKNTTALAVGVASNIGTVATVGVATAACVGMVACSPVTAVVGGVAGAVTGPFMNDDTDFFRCGIKGSGPLFSVAASVAGGAVGAGFGLVGPSFSILHFAIGDGEFTSKTRRKLINALTYFNYYPEARHYVKNSRISTKEIADKTEQKLVDALCLSGVASTGDPELAAPTPVERNAPVAAQPSTAPPVERTFTYYSLPRRPVVATAPPVTSAPAMAFAPPAAFIRPASGIQDRPQFSIAGPSVPPHPEPAPRQVQGVRAKGNWHFPENEENADAFNTFHRRLTKTAEYKHWASRRRLTKRVDHLVTAMRESPHLRNICFHIAADALAHCNDRVALALEDMEMAKINYEAEKGLVSNIELFSIGENIFKVSVLDKIALDKIKDCKKEGIEPDEIEVRLFYHTKLVKRLALPPSVANTMLHADIAPVSPEELTAAAEEVEALLKKSESVDFLAQWQPWRGAMRRMHPERYAEIDRFNEHIRGEIVLPPPRMNQQQWIDTFPRQEQFEHLQVTNLTTVLTRKFIQENGLE